MASFQWDILWGTYCGKREGGGLQLARNSSASLWELLEKANFSCRANRTSTGVGARAHCDVKHWSPGDAVEKNVASVETVL